MNKVTIRIVGVLLIAMAVFAVGCKKKNKPDAKKAFIKYFGGLKGHNAAEVLQVTDGGYVIAGTGISGADPGNILVIKTDAEGNEIWNQSIGDATTYDECGSVAIMPDGGYIVIGTCGYTKDRVWNVNALEVTKDSTAIFATRLSAFGTIIWSIRYPSPSLSYVKIGTFGKSVVVNDNGECLLAGMVDSSGVNSSTNIYAFLIDANGVLLQRSAVNTIPYIGGATGGSNDNVFNAIRAFGSGLEHEYIISTSTTISGENTPRLVPIRLSGNALLQNQGVTKTDWLEPTYNDAQQISRLSGQNYLLVGTKGTPSLSSDIYAIQLSNSGGLSKLNSWTYGDTGAGSIDIGISAISTSDGGYAILGVTNSLLYTKDAAKLNDVLLIKVNSSGVVEWEKVFGGRGNDSASRLIQTSDGGYVICGTIAFGDDVSNSGNSNAISIIKLNQNGDLTNVE